MGQKTLVLLALTLSILCSSRLMAQPTMSEYHVKALFLLNFIKYVDWPAQAATGGNGPIVIGTMGQDALYQELQHEAEGKSVDGRGIVVRHLSDGDDASGCAILFIGSSEDSQLDKILGKAGSLPILTVGEDDSFLNKGGIINLGLKDSKIHLEINLKAARKVQLEISSKLLSVADVKRD